MARPGVTYYDISRAAEAVKARGSEPTIDRVREQLGTGSKSTIAPLLKQWRNNAELNIEESDSGLPSDLISAVKSLRDRVQQASEEAVEQAKQDYQSRVQTLERTLADTQKELSEALGRERTLKQQITDLETNSRKLNGELNRLESRFAVTESERDALQARMQEHKETVSELKDENRAVRDHFEHYQQRTAEDRQLERDQFQSQLRQLQSQVESLTMQLTRSQTEKENYRSRYDNAQGQAEKIAYENQELRLKLECCGTRIKELEAECDNKNKEIIEFDQNISQFRTEVQSLKERLAIKSATFKGVETDLQEIREYADRLEAENKEISEEKAVLQGRLVQLQASLGDGE
ncbi:DNA-binding protein [Halioxenophilus aromaticivorans]|uniref:KfrA N-terminal DNA-binding domain-containing protein n=1 Tax=Halioxenophilus aromaticivorans TaxID=1306992 RepID=A0AAV3U2S1_9ALTE